MATISPTAAVSGAVTVVSWAGMATGDTINSWGTDVPAENASVHFTGTFGGATVTLGGSLDGTNFITLLDYQGDGLSKTAAAIERVGTGAKLYKPTIAGGTGDSVTVTLTIWNS